MLRSPCVALIAAACLWTSSVAAQSTVPLVVDVTTFATSPRTDALEPFVQDVTSLRPGSYEMVSIADPEFIESLRWWLPNGSSDSCQTIPPPIGENLTEARTLWNQLDLSSALAKLTQVRDTLQCQTEAIPLDDLQAVIFLEAAVHYYLEDGMDGGTFAEFATMFPDAEPQSGYAPEIIAAFRTSSAQISKVKKLRLEIPPELAPHNPILDGVPTLGKNVVQVKPGQHFMQIAGPNGEIRSELFTVFAGTSQDLLSVADVLPLRTPVVSATLRAQISSGRVDDSMILGLSRYAKTNSYPYLLFVVPDPTSSTQMSVRSLADNGRFEQGPPSDYQVAEAPRVRSNKNDDDSVIISGPSVKPPRRRDSSSSSRRPLRVDETDTRVGVGVGIVYYDGVAFGTIQPSIEIALGPVALQATGIYGMGPELAHLPGARLAVLKRFYVGPFAPHAGLAYELLAARVVTGGGANTLVIEGTPELIGGTEFALNDSNLRLTSQLGVGFTPGLAVLGGQGFEDDGRTSVTFSVGAAWTW